MTADSAPTPSDELQLSTPPIPAPSPEDHRLDDRGQAGDGHSGPAAAIPSEDSPAEASAAEVSVAEVSAAEVSAADGPKREAVEQPAKLLRIGSMIKQLLEEVRHAPLDEASRSRLKEIYETSVQELAQGLSPDLRAELGRLALPLETQTPSDAELRIAQAQLVGWLEGLFHGIQATLFAQQMAARAQLEEMMQQRGLPPGRLPAEPEAPGGAYL